MAGEQVDIVKGSPEYEAAMIAKFESSQATEQPASTSEAPQVPTRPEHIPEKFWDAEKGEVRLEALAKSYAELEKTRGGKPTDAPKEPTTAVTQDAAQAAVESAGLDFTALNTEYAEAGALSEDTYKALEGKGIPKAMVDSYIAGQEALAVQWKNSAFAEAGGEEQYTKMVEWAKESLSPAEKVAFNKAAESGTIDEFKLAISGLKGRFESANGKSAKLLSGESPSSTSQGYQSRAQMTADMKNPLYKTDPAFRKSVENKLAVTTSF